MLDPEPGEVKGGGRGTGRAGRGSGSGSGSGVSAPGISKPAPPRMSRKFWNDERRLELATLVANYLKGGAHAVVRQLMMLDGQAPRMHCACTAHALHMRCTRACITYPHQGAAGRVGAHRHAADAAVGSSTGRSSAHVELREPAVQQEDGLGGHCSPESSGSATEVRGLSTTSPHPLFSPSSRRAPPPHSHAHSLARSQRVRSPFITPPTSPLPLPATTHPPRSGTSRARLRLTRTCSWSSTTSISGTVRPAASAPRAALASATSRTGPILRARRCPVATRALCRSIPRK